MSGPSWHDDIITEYVPDPTARRQRDAWAKRAVSAEDEVDRLQDTVINQLDEHLDREFFLEQELTHVQRCLQLKTADEIQRRVIERNQKEREKPKISSAMCSHLKTMILKDAFFALIRYNKNSPGEIDITSVADTARALNEFIGKIYDSNQYRPTIKELTEEDQQELAAWANRG